MANLTLNTTYRLLVNLTRVSITPRCYVTFVCRGLQVNVIRKTELINVIDSWLELWNARLMQNVKFCRYYVIGRSVITGPDSAFGRLDKLILWQFPYTYTCISVITIVFVKGKQTVNACGPIRQRGHPVSPAALDLMLGVLLTEHGSVIGAGSCCGVGSTALLRMGRGGDCLCKLLTFRRLTSTIVDVPHR